MDSTRDAPAPSPSFEQVDELLELTRLLRVQLSRHAALGAWAAPGAAIRFRGLPFSASLDSGSRSAEEDLWCDEPEGGAAQDLGAVPDTEIDDGAITCGAATSRLLEPV